MYQMCSGLWNFKGKPDASYQIAKYRAGQIYIYIYIPIPQLSIPRIPILPRAVSILGSLQFRYDTSVQFSSF